MLNSKNTTERNFREQRAQLYRASLVQGPRAHTSPWLVQTSYLSIEEIVLLYLVMWPTGTIQGSSTQSEGDASTKDARRHKGMTSIAHGSSYFSISKVDGRGCSAAALSMRRCCVLVLARIQTLVLVTWHKLQVQAAIWLVGLHSILALAEKLSLKLMTLSENIGHFWNRNEPVYILLIVLPNWLTPW